jgi:2'-5' RNA ligase
MVDRALHGLGQVCETGEDERSGLARHEVSRCTARQGQGEGVTGVSLASRKMRWDAPRVGGRVDRQGQVEHGKISDGAGSLSPRLKPSKSKPPPSSSKGRRIAEASVSNADEAAVELRSQFSQRCRMIYVLAYPDFEPSVAGNIARFRRAHEPERAKLVEPHVTLVFGLRGVRPLEFVASCEKIAVDVSEIAVDFVATDIVHDPFEKTYKLFLLNSTGRDDLTALHERLYDGLNRSELHPAIPFRPHMTVATHSERAIIERLDATEIGAFPISGKIRALEIVELVEKTLVRLRTIPLRK